VLIGGGHVDDDDPSGGTEVDRLKELIQRLGLAEVVQLLGSLPQVELPRYYAAADCVVVPSHYESFGLVAVEAMACGTPVVASRVGGLSLSVKDGETGFLVPARDDAAFADRIGRLVRSPELVTRLGQAAARRRPGPGVVRLRPGRAVCTRASRGLNFSESRGSFRTRPSA